MKRWTERDRFRLEQLQRKFADTDHPKSLGEGYV
jgi:hypothetical protein